MVIDADQLLIVLQFMPCSIMRIFSILIVHIYDLVINVIENESFAPELSLALGKDRSWQFLGLETDLFKSGITLMGSLKYR